MQILFVRVLDKQLWLIHKVCFVHYSRIVNINSEGLIFDLYMLGHVENLTIL